MLKETKYHILFNLKFFCCWRWFFSKENLWFKDAYRQWPSRSIEIQVK